MSAGASTRSPSSFELVWRTDEHCACIRFPARYRGQPVSWTVTVMSLRHYFEHYVRRGLAPDIDHATVHPFIEVESEPSDEMNARVALGVARVDEPTLRKVVIMMRQYKRLRAGRHEFNPPARFRVLDED